MLNFPNINKKDVKLLAHNQKQPLKSCSIPKLITGDYKLLMVDKKGVE